MRYFKLAGTTGPMGGSGPSGFGAVIRRNPPHSLPRFGPHIRPTMRLPPPSQAGFVQPINLSPRNKDPNRGRFAGFAGSAGNQIPLEDGTPGSLVWPYEERDGVFNPGINDGGVGNPPLVGEAISPVGIQPDGLAVSSPNGESDRPWYNPTTFAAVPIQQGFTPAASVAAIIPQQPFLSLNNQRNALIIQNNSVAPTTGDTAPIFYIGFNVQPVIGFSLALAAGLGIIFDVICPRDSVYIAFGPFADAGSSVIIQGVVVQGTYSP